jgi:hypothetical protein
VDEQHEDSNEPLVGEVAEDDEEGREAVVQRVLEEVPLRTDEHVAEEPAEVLPELQDVEHLHLEGRLHHSRNRLRHRVRRPPPAQPRRHEHRLLQNQERPQRTPQVVETRVSPLHQRIAPFLPGIRLDVSLLGYVEPLTEGVA